ncbi:MAG: hypothetical protein V4764_18465 [Burkholderia sp.]
MAYFDPERNKLNAARPAPFAGKKKSRVSGFLKMAILNCLVAATMMVRSCRRRALRGNGFAA